MITKPTVLILGAGASINYGFPSGLQLKAHICNEIRRKSRRTYNDLVSYRYEGHVQEDVPEHVKDFYNNLLLSSEMSIDAFLEHNPEYSEIGRRAIANVLLRRENHVELFDNWIDKWLDPENKDKHWYQLLFSKLNARFEDFKKNKLKIITFNYDRSLEYFLLQSMKAKYSAHDDAEILEKLKSIPILHIYGKLGKLPGYDSEESSVPYGLGQDPGRYREHIDSASEQIITIHQAEEMQKVLKEARAYLRWAKRIYFLGFGYDQTNMELLFDDNGTNLLTASGLTLGDRCFGTAMGVSPHRMEYLRSWGLEGLRYDRGLKNRNETHKPFRFPDCTIYDFLYYNLNGRLD